MLLAVDVCLAKIYLWVHLWRFLNHGYAWQKRVKAGLIVMKVCISQYLATHTAPCSTPWHFVTLDSSFPCWLLLSPIKTCKMCGVPQKRVWRARLEGFLWITGLCICFGSMAVPQDLWVVNTHKHAQCNIFATSTSSSTARFEMIAVQAAALSGSGLQRRPPP